MPQVIDYLADIMENFGSIPIGDVDRTVVRPQSQHGVDLLGFFVYDRSNP